MIFTEEEIEELRTWAHEQMPRFDEIPEWMRNYEPERRPARIEISIEPLAQDGSLSCVFRTVARAYLRDDPWPICPPLAEKRL